MPLGRVEFDRPDQLAAQSRLTIYAGEVAELVNRSFGTVVTFAFAVCRAAINPATSPAGIRNTAAEAHSGMTKARRAEATASTPAPLADRQKLLGRPRTRCS